MSLRCENGVYTETDAPTLGRTTPCAGCPWRRTSLRGWLGDDNPLHFYQVSIAQESLMPCHAQINYGDPEWLTTQLPYVDLCAGQLIYFRNHLKSPRRPALAAAVARVKKSAAVFSQPWEFLRHHMPQASDEVIKQLSLKASYPPGVIE